MAASFDGDNLVITLESAVTNLDILSVYKDWKEWALAGNLRYPQAFRSDGGAPLSDVVDQGSYIFLNNVSGWRMRPPEEDITVYLTGNLAVEDTDLPAFIPTIGAYTAAILGLQPVTQGFSANLAAGLEYSAFLGGVAIDPDNGYAGTGTTLDGDPIGTRENPVNNMTDLHTISTNLGLRDIFVMGDLDNTVMSGFDISSESHRFVGDNPFIVVAVEATADISGSAMQNLSLFGELDGLNTIRACSVNTVTNVSGFLEKCAFTSTVELTGPVSIMECYSQVAGAGYPVFKVGNNSMQVRDWHGSIGVSGVTGGTHTIELYGGRVYIDATCTGGTIYLRGAYSTPPSILGSTVVVDQTRSKVEDDIHKANFRRRVHDNMANTITVYEADGITPEYVFDTNDDLSDISPQ